MLRGLLPFIFLTVLLPLAPAQQPPAAATPGFDADAVAQEVHSFYVDYWKAWDKRDPDAVAGSLAPDFVALTYVEPQGAVQVDRAAAIAGVRNFFEAVHQRDTLWRRSLLSVVPRSGTEAMAAVRNDFSLEDSVAETELSLEVLHKGPDGRWRLLRRWSEKHTF